MNAFQLRDVTGVRLVGRQGSEGRGSRGGGGMNWGGGGVTGCVHTARL